MADRQQVESEKDALLQRKGREIENLQSKLKVITDYNIHSFNPSLFVVLYSRL